MAARLLTDRNGGGHHMVPAVLYVIIPGGWGDFCTDVPHNARKAERGLPECCRQIGGQISAPCTGNGFCAEVVRSAW